MKKILLGGALAIVGASGSFAADLPAKAPVSKPAAWSWTGFYAGVHGGYGWGKNDTEDFLIFGLAPVSSKPAGGFGGAQVGYNWQFAPHWLIGTEADFSFGDIKDSQFGGEFQDKINSFGTARTRFGYVQDNLLIYGTGGAIWMRDKAQVSAGAPPLFIESRISEYHVSWVIGGGVEYAFDPHWSFKFEYLYAPFDTSHDEVFTSTPALPIFHTSDLTFQAIRAGVNYRFGDAGARAASMPVKAAPRSEWNGSYIGAHGGYGWAKLDQNVVTDTIAPGTISLPLGTKPDGFFGGIQGGYNWVFAPQWLLGIEVDSSWGGLKDSVSNGLPVSAKIEDLGTARLRLGYLLKPDVLIYGTGGVAYAREKTSSSIITLVTKEDHVGWVAGGGVEYKFAPDWSVKAEYDYADLGSLNHTENADVFGFTGFVSRHSAPTLQTVKVGLNYYGPVIERFFGGK